MFIYGKKMIELFNILFFSIFLSLLFFVPFINKVKISNRKFILDDHDLRVLNILILFNLILIFVILNLKISQIVSIFYSIIFIFIIYFLINFKKLIFQKDIYFYLFFYSLILFILSIDLSNNLTLYWDGQKLWLPKAIIFYNNGYVSDLSSTAYSHYSFLGSLLWAFFWKISSFEYEYFGRIFFLAIYCFALFNFLSMVSINKNLKIISFLLLILLTYDYWHFRGTQEILIFSFLLILTKYLFNLLIKNQNNKINLSCFLLCLNLIIWTKNEGIILSLIISLIILIFLKESVKFKLILLFIPLLMILIRFISFKLNGLDVDLSQDFDFSNIFTIFINNFSITNIFLISKYIVFSAFKFPHIILSLLFAILICFNKSLFKKYIFLYVYLFLSISLIFLIYLSSTFNMEFMVSTGSLRLMFEFSAPYLLFILVFFKERFKI